MRRLARLAVAVAGAAALAVLAVPAAASGEVTAGGDGGPVISWWPTCCGSEN